MLVLFKRKHEAQPFWHKEKLAQTFRCSLCNSLIFFSAQLKNISNFLIFLRSRAYSLWQTQVFVHEAALQIQGNKWIFSHAQSCGTQPRRRWKRFVSCLRALHMKGYSLYPYVSLENTSIALKITYEGGNLQCNQLLCWQEENCMWLPVQMLNRLSFNIKKSKHKMWF